MDKQETLEKEYVDGLKKFIVDTEEKKKVTPEIRKEIQESLFFLPTETEPAADQQDDSPPAQGPDDLV